MFEKTVPNNNSTMPLILGILSIIIPFLGLVLGVIGIIVSRKAKVQGSNGLVIAGLICSVIGIIIQLFVVFSFLSYFFITSTG